MFRAFRYAGIIAADRRCEGADAALAQELWNVYRAPLGTQSWIENAGRDVQVKCLLRLLEQPAADGLIDVVMAFSLHHKWPLSPTGAGPTVQDAMRERFQLVASSVGAGPPSDDPDFGHATQFDAHWSALRQALQLEETPNEHSVARAIMRHQLRYQLDRNAVAMVGEHVGGMQLEASLWVQETLTALRRVPREDMVPE